MKTIQTETEILPTEELSLLKIMDRVWISSVVILGIGIVVKALGAAADGHFSVVEISQLFLATVLFLSWLYFKPLENVKYVNPDHILPRCPTPVKTRSSPDELYSSTTQTRMAELENYHMISQEYIFPFPYLCQIYHLLNLKHLEDVHNFSLSNLKIVKVSEFQPTAIGGMIRFQTMLESPLNTLRVWRQPLVEVDLILHTPYTVELNIPAYNDKRVVVIFNVCPLTKTEHKLQIDIYSNLEWPKPILQVLFHIASCLTVVEDLPYLRRLAERKLDRLLHPARYPNHETMLLFRRFAELYGATA